MKKLFLLLFIFPLISLAQVQIGQDIDGEAAFDYSGTSIDLSADGSILAIGAPGNDDNGSNSGQVRVYENIGGSWIQIGQDINGEAIDDKFGTSVSLSSDGLTLAIGAPGYDMINYQWGDNAGLVRVYNYINSEWVQYGLDIYGESGSDSLGFAVSLSADGNTLAIGESGYNPDYHVGRVRIFDNINGSWVPTSFTVIDNIEYDTFLGHIGYDGDLKLSKDGNVVACGTTNPSFYSGSTYINKKNEDVWTQVGSTITGIYSQDACGDAIGLSADGSIIAVGTSRYGYEYYDFGKVSVYEIIGEELIQKGSDIIGQGNNDNVGLSLSADGTILAIGERGGYKGSVKMYKFIDGDWVQISSAIEGEADFDNSSRSICLSDDGTILAIGAKNNDGSNGTDSGHVRVYNVEESVLVLSTKSKVLESFTIYPNPTKNKFTIQLENNTELKNVIIYNNLGQQVLVSNETVINTSKLSIGIYVVEIETNKGKGSKKLIIE
ncbi:T9SS type A sorting domain-containing protein [uncultured Winogradskyella sp.]|uniref:T9SS type A sorting domain-containing protein n=1 Tax=uncultured Winogradskyella sp. TaxID=395353 RepID=UPI0030ED8523